MGRLPLPDHKTDQESAMMFTRFVTKPQGSAAPGRGAPMTAVLTALLLVPLALAAGPRPRQGKAKVFKTPQEAFAALSAAMKKPDENAMLECLTPEAQQT